MSIWPAVCDIIVRHGRVRGDVVLIGRQTIEQGCFIDGERPSDDFDLFGRLGAKTVQALDISPYEGAGIIHDLNSPLPYKYWWIADFIFDGSCLDNIFNAATAMRSFSEILRPGGTMVLMEHSTSMQSAIVCFSPEWFFNFFAVNKYETCEITLFSFPRWRGMHGKWKARRWTCYDENDRLMPTTVKDSIRGIGDFITVVVARKGDRSTDNLYPVQGLYRNLHKTDSDRYLALHKRTNGPIP
jgi:hypothetical protein